RVRPDDDAGHQIAEHRRQVQRAEGNHAEDGGRQQQKREFERGQRHDGGDLRMNTGQAACRARQMPRCLPDANQTTLLYDLAGFLLYESFILSRMSVNHAPHAASAAASVDTDRALKFGRETLQIEADALLALKQRMSGDGAVPFVKATQLLLN